MELDIGGNHGIWSINIYNSCSTNAMSQVYIQSLIIFILFSRSNRRNGLFRGCGQNSNLVQYFSWYFRRRYLWIRTGKINKGLTQQLRLDHFITNQEKQKSCSSCVIVTHFSILVFSLSYILIFLCFPSNFTAIQFFLYLWYNQFKFNTLHFSNNHCVFF